MSTLIFNETPTAFPWYDKLEKQDRFRENVLEGCWFKLIAPKNTLLPFQFRKAKAPELPTKWEIMSLANDPVINISNNIGLIKGKSLSGMDYIYFGGNQLTFIRVINIDEVVEEPLNLPPGYYYSKLTFPSSSFYSEIFYVPSKPFLFSDQDTNEYLRLVWYNNTDMEPFYYNDKVDDVPIFKNVLFLDTFTTSSEPEIIEEGDKDGAGNIVPDFQQAVIKYRISLIVPDYLKLALVLIQMHSYIFLHERKNLRSGDLKRVNTSTGLEANGAMSTVDIIYEQDLAIIKTGCSNALPVDASGGGAPVLTSLVNNLGVLRFIGTAPADAWVDVYGSATEMGTYRKLSGNIRASVFATGIYLNATQYMECQWFYVKALNFNYDYGNTAKAEKPA